MMKNKIKTIWNKIDRELNKHDNLILFIAILIVIFLLGAFAYCLYTAFTISPYLGVLTLVIEFGILAWLDDQK